MGGQDAIGWAAKMRSDGLPVASFVAPVGYCYVPPSIDTVIKTALL
jgi:hypothetical protein